ncbi:hypothetical protein [Bradyrhizobium sp.]|uniref:hypothetical protein n=1 Tax=Bradyrhizobium sp. TaxID=376 RepID=UPI003C73F308
MKWKKERDLLIAQTMAFVQSVAGRTTEVEGTEVESRVEPIPLDEPTEVERPVETVAITRPSAVRHSELREEIRGRVAAFRAHQELFNRNRDEYCDSVLAKVRASTEHPSTAPGSPPAKH